MKASINQTYCYLYILSTLSSVTLTETICCNKHVLVYTSYLHEKKKKDFCVSDMTNIEGDCCIFSALPVIKVWIIIKYFHILTLCSDDQQSKPLSVLFAISLSKITYYLHIVYSIHGHCVKNRQWFNYDILMCPLWNSCNIYIIFTTNFMFYIDQLTLILGLHM
jgi:hypothetical protein